MTAPAAPPPHADSWYSATAAPLPDHPALAGETTCDVAVVGGGYTGLTCALDLAARGYDVVLLEARRIGWGASGRNGGQIVTGFNQGAPELTAMVGPDDARRIWDLGEEAKRLLVERVERHAIDCDLRWGYLFAAIKPRQVFELQDLQDEWLGLGYGGTEIVTGDDLARYVVSPRYRGGLYDPGSGQLHPLNYALGLGRAAAAAGVRVFEGTPVTRLEAGEPAVLSTPTGRVRARWVALAGNAYLSGMSGAVRRRVRPRIMPCNTWIVATEPLGEERARAILPGDVAVGDLNFVLDYYRLTPDRRLLFGGIVSYSMIQRGDPGPATRRRIARVFPALADVGIDHCWGGLVGITVNRLPDFGRVAPNVVYAQGFSGQGVALTGIAGRLMAETIAGTAERFDLMARIPHRDFPGGRLLRMPALVLGTLWYRLRDLVG
jgi:gamma-glutamylputrescine oxidase